MKLLLTILLFTALSARAQEPFVINKSYPVGWVVYYPVDTFWITTRALVAKSSPSVLAGWKRYYYQVSTPAPIPTSPTVEVVTKPAFDSLTSILGAVTKRLQQLESKPMADTSLGTYKVSLFGASIFRVIDPKTYMIRSLIKGPDIDFVVTDSTIMPILIRKQMTIMPTIKAPKKTKK